MSSIGNIDQVNYNFIRKFKSFNGDKLSPNDETYSSLVKKIKDVLHEIGEDCKNGRLFDTGLWLAPIAPLQLAGLASIDFVDSGEMSRSNNKLSTIFDSFSQAVVNLNDKVNKTKNSDELRNVIEDFNDQFIFKLKFTATETIPGYRYISSSSLGPFSAHTWFDDATKKDKIKDDNGAYKLIGQLVDRVYGMLNTTLNTAGDIISKKKNILDGTDASGSGSQPQKPNDGNTVTTLDSRIRSLFNKKSRLEQKQASLIKEIKSLTTEARRVYVRQFLNEADTTNADAKEKNLTHAETDKMLRDIEQSLDGKKQNMTSMDQYKEINNGQKSSTPETSSDAPTYDEITSTTSTIKVPSNNPVYTAIKDLLARRDQLFKYYEDSVSYFNKISKNAKYLQDLMSGKYKDFRNMSMKDRISAFNNAKYEFKDNSKDADATQDASLTNTVAPSSQAEQPKPTEPTNSPIRATVAPGQAPTNAGPSAPPTSTTQTASGNTQPNADSNQKTNQPKQ